MTATCLILMNDANTCLPPAPLLHKLAHDTTAQIGPRHNSVEQGAGFVNTLEPYCRQLVACKPEPDHHRPAHVQHRDQPVIVCMHCRHKQLILIPQLEQLQSGDAKVLAAPDASAVFWST